MYAPVSTRHFSTGYPLIVLPRTRPDPLSLIKPVSTRKGLHTAPDPTNIPPLMQWSAPSSTLLTSTAPSSLITDLFLQLRDVRKSLYQADSSARHLLHTHTIALLYAGDLQHTLALFFLSANADLSTERSARAVSLLNLYSDFTLALPPTSAALPFPVSTF